MIARDRSTGVRGPRSQRARILQRAGGLAGERHGFACAGHGRLLRRVEAGASPDLEVGDTIVARLVAFQGTHEWLTLGSVLRGEVLYELERCVTAVRELGRAIPPLDP